MTELTVTLTGDTAAILERMTAEGGYSSPAAALAALLKEQVGDDAALDEWLRTVGVARFDAHRADPSRAVSLADARARLLGGG